MHVFMKRWSWLAAVAGLAMYSNSAMATFYDQQYEMAFSPDTVAGAISGSGAGSHPLLVGSGTDGTGSHTGSTFSGGIMTYLDDNSGPGGNTGYYLSPSDTLLIGSSNFIVDMRIKINSDPTPGTGKEMSFKSGGQGRGLKIDTTGVQFVNGGGGVGSASGGTFNVFTQFRVIINGGTNTADIYSSTDGDVDNGNGDNNLLASTAMGGSGFASELGAIGFTIGSLAGSSSTANFDLDWYRVESGTSNVNAVWEVVPEPATLALLALGGIPMMIRRRRAA